MLSKTTKYRLYKLWVLSSLFMQVSPPRPPANSPADIWQFWQTAKLAFDEAYPKGRV